MVQRIISWYKRPNKSFIADTLESLIVIIPIVFLIKTFVFGLYQVPTCSMEPTMLVGERFFAEKFTIFFQPPKRGDVIAFNNPVYAYSKNPAMNLFERYVSWHVVSWTKRVVGIPGDHVQGRIEGGKTAIYLNGQKLDEPYVNQYPIIELFKEELVVGNNSYSGLCRRTFDPSKKWDEQPFYRINPTEIVLAKKYCPKNIFYPYEPTNKDIFDVQLGENQYWVMGDNRQGSSDCRSWGPLDGKLIHGKIVLRLWSSDSDESWWMVDLLKHPIDFWTRMRWSRFFNLVY